MRNWPEMDKNTFKLSALCLLLSVAGLWPECGEAHGNYGVFFLNVREVPNLLEALELLNLPMSKTEIRKDHCDERWDLTFLHAPKFHPAMRLVGAYS